MSPTKPTTKRLDLVNARLSLNISPYFLMAGTFYARESVSALYNFVREALRDDWLPFELLGPGGLKLTDENLAFNECGLVSIKKIAGTFHRGLQVVRVICCS